LKIAIFYIPHRYKRAFRVCQKFRTSIRPISHAVATQLTKFTYRQKRINESNALKVVVVQFRRNHLQCAGNTSKPTYTLWA